MTAAIEKLAMNVGVAMGALRANTLRSALTMLGIVIGVAAVILMVALGRGAQTQITESINALGTNIVLVFPTPDTEGGGFTPPSGRLTQRDARAVARALGSVAEVAPQLRVTGRVAAGGAYATTSVLGIDPAYAVLTNSRAGSGRMIEERDVRTSADVVVLGETVARKLFAGSDPLDKIVRINRVPVRVIGVMAAKGDGLIGDQDDLVLLPITTVRQRLGTPSTNAAPDSLTALFIQFSEGYDLATGMDEVRGVMRARYSVQEGEVDPFTVTSTEEFARQSERVLGVVQAGLVGIASISLLVGAIGIMNIMLVSVTERTREIGLRMAIGARRSDIRNQFLVEAATLCAVGGLIGVALGVGGSAVVNAVADWGASVDPMIVLIAIGASALVGVAAGYYPAFRASRMNPIDALRHE